VVRPRTRGQVFCRGLPASTRAHHLANLMPLALKSRARIKRRSATKMYGLEVILIRKPLAAKTGDFAVPRIRLYRGVVI